MTSKNTLESEENITIFNNNEYVTKVHYKFYCDDCHYKCCKQSDWDKHCLTQKHLFRTGIEPQKKTKKTHDFFCESCNFSCSKLSKWKTHIETNKHKKFKPKIEYMCEFCETSYKSKSGLWYHKQRCLNKEDEKITQKLITPILMVLLIQQNCKECEQ